MSIPATQSNWPGLPPAILAVFVVVGSLAALTMLGYELTFQRYDAAAYITALAINFFTVAFAFITALDVIMLQPTDF